MEVLTQSEIDKLLEALDSGKLDVSQVQKGDGKKIKKYDFRRPNKFGKEQMRTLHVVHEYYARLLTTYLSGILRTLCHVEIVSVEEQIFHEFNNSLPDSVLLAVINMPPLKGSLLMEISHSVVYGMIDRILGGAGTEIEEERDYTEIELAILQRILTRIIGLFRDSWANVIEVEPVLDRIETNSRFIQVVSPNETIAIITLSVMIGEVKGFINVCIPHISIKPFEELMSRKQWLSENTPVTNPGEKNSNIMNKLQKSAVDIKVILGSTTIKAQDIMELQPGDVIQLSSRKDDAVDIYIGNKVKFRAVPGLRNNKVAVKIISKVDEEAEDE